MQAAKLQDLVVHRPRTATIGVRYKIEISKIKIDCKTEWYTDHALPQPSVRYKIEVSKI
jgi:hypothetical protein